eukprot:scaffold225531_cov21-Tisochrysis_lutea.AAC.1
MGFAPKRLPWGIKYYQVGYCNCAAIIGLTHDCLPILAVTRLRFIHLTNVLKATAMNKLPMLAVPPLKFIHLTNALKATAMTDCQCWLYHRSHSFI